jgi:hypothetical protein
MGRALSLTIQKIRIIAPLLGNPQSNPNRANWRVLEPHIVGNISVQSCSCFVFAARGQLRREKSIGNLPCLESSNESFAAFSQQSTDSILNP